MDNKIWLGVNQAGKAKAKVEEEAKLETKEKVEAEAIEKTKVVAWLKREEGKNAILESIEKVRLEMEGSIKVKD